MKKLIKMLSSLALFSCPAVAVVSYNGQENKILGKTGNENSSNNINTNLNHSALIANDQTEHQVLEELEKVDQEIDAWLSNVIILADGNNTYKIEKDKIEQALTKLVVDKKMTLKFEFISKIFNDNDLIYKTKDPFKIRITITSDLEDELAISKLHKAPVIEGLSKEYMEHKAVRETIKNLFANEKFTNRLVGLTNIKVNGENTVKELIGSLNKLTNAEIFGENEDLNKYKFQYYTNLNKNTELIVEHDIVIDLNVYDQDAEMSFFSTKFDIKIPVETDQEEYDRISEKIKAYLTNKELDLSKYEELNADGIIQWKETLSKIVDPDKNYDYFNFEALGEKFKLQYPSVVGFELTLDVEKNVEIANDYFTFNSEQNYISVKLKVFKKETSDSNYKEKNVDLKIKVGGLTNQQIVEKKQDSAKQIFSENVKDRLFKINGNEITEFLMHYVSTKWTWSNLLSYFEKNFFTYFGFNKLNITQEQITDYVDVEFLTIFDADKDQKLELDTPIFDSISGSDKNKIELKITSIKDGKKIDGSEIVISFFQDFSQLRLAHHYVTYFNTIFTKNIGLFNNEVVKFKQNADETPLKLNILYDYVANKLNQFLGKDTDFCEIPKYFHIWANIMDQDKTDIKNYEKLKDIDIKTGTYYFYFDSSNKKYDSGAVATTVFPINVIVE